VLADSGSERVALPTSGWPSNKSHIGDALCILHYFITKLRLFANVTEESLFSALEDPLLSVYVTLRMGDGPLGVSRNLFGSLLLGEHVKRNEWEKKQQKS
jgi:hypothetical protein